MGGCTRGGAEGAWNEILSYQPYETTLNTYFTW